ncbi:MAG TPA: FmdB family zinc ribbon protein [Steroidobacteraceae bacterium]|nr:FmdB family zinc ribbon protein [Steroidobacteraceae bacterium]
MPFYEYECTSCKFYSEVMQKITDAPLKKCPSCGKNTLKKLVSAPVFRLKGGGWYETDFKSDKEAKRNLAEAEKKEAEAKPETKPAEATEAKATEVKSAESKSADAKAPASKAADTAASSDRAAARKSAPPARKSVAVGHRPRTVHRAPKPKAKAASRSSRKGRR